MDDESHPSSHRDKAREAGNESSHSQASSSGDSETRYQRSEEYVAKQQIKQDNRLRLARKWVLIVESYYFCRAVFIIFPTFGESNKDYQVVAEIL